MGHPVCHQSNDEAIKTIKRANPTMLERNNPGLRDKPVFIIPSPTQEGKGVVNWHVSNAGIIKYNVRKDYMIIDWNVKYRKWFGQARRLYRALCFCK